ncbi:DoxX family protein [Epilithonimonas sp.]|uniref:HvfX family Cu-binding RiPP maturation protein n=1 Tax=Epilithonimonas sp. TaxID=2894511 RepID=UPI0035B4731A
MLKKIELSLNKLQDLPLLAIRMILAYGFYDPAMKKLQDINAIGDWFASLHIPAPYFQAYLATGTEILGVILLTLGLFTRIISFPLIITMIVAIVTVHWENGFSSGNNGFEIPLYYIIMLITLICFGAGRISLGHLLIRKNTKISD